LEGSPVSVSVPDSVPLSLPVSVLDPDPSPDMFVVELALSLAVAETRSSPQATSKHGSSKTR
jgi:hypothetical protein